MKEIYIKIIIGISIFIFITNCKKEDDILIVLPKADFVINKSNIIINDTIKFANKSLNSPNKWKWDFGDGSESNISNPKHSYENEGTYTITLEVSNKDGSNITEKDISVFTDTLVDIDGNIYKTIRIGNQEWMAENLRVTHYPNGDSIPYYEPELNIYTERYSYKYLNGEKCFLYNYITAVGNGNIYSDTNPSGIQGVAPNDWHIPSQSEWLELINFLGGEEIAGGKMKVQGTDYWYSPNVGATNSSMFFALPTGRGEGFQRLSCVWWSCSNVSYPLMYSIALNHKNTKSPIGGSIADELIAIRCVKN